MAESEQGNPQETRERSTISFPYADLDEAVAVATAILNQGGGQGTLDQLAAWLKHEDINSGAFRTKLNSARIFGLIDTGRGEVRLTPLGKRAADPKTEKSARAEAFLAVPLYAQVFDRHRGSKLPDDVGIEAEFKNLGVSGKQASRARQTFQRSADQAGFFEHGKDRLIKPPIDGEGGKEKKVDGGEVPPRKPSSVGITDTLHPFIRGLLEVLPAPGSQWPDAERQHWLKTAEAIFGLIYGLPEKKAEEAAKS